MSTPQEVLSFWFGEPAQGADELMMKMRRWYQGGEEMDRAIGDRFGADTEAALLGERDRWAKELHGRVALILLLDQFPRSLWRDQPKAYAGDPQAQRLACQAFDEGLEKKVSIEERNFLIMPLVHAEDLALQERAVSLMDRLVADAPAPLQPVFAMGIEQTRKYRDLIARYGRFPHRNPVLGRSSTPEELELLKTWREFVPPRRMTAGFMAQPDPAPHGRG